MKWITLTILITNIDNNNNHNDTNNDNNIPDEEDEDGSDPMILASKYDLHVRSAATDASVKAHVPVPTQAEIGAIVVDEKKRLLLEKFNMM